MNDPRSDRSAAIRRFALPLALLVFGLPVGRMGVMALGNPPADKDPFIPIDGTARAQERTLRPQRAPVGRVQRHHGTPRHDRLAAGPAYLHHSYNLIVFVPMLIAIWDEARHTDRLHPPAAQAAS